MELMSADICPRYLSHKSVSRSPVAVQALVPDFIRVKQWPLYQDRGVQRHSCSTGAGVEPVAATGGWDGGLERCESSDREDRSGVGGCHITGQAAGLFTAGCC